MEFFPKKTEKYRVNLFTRTNTMTGAYGMKDLRKTRLTSLLKGFVEVLGS